MTGETGRPRWQTTDSLSNRQQLQENACTGAEDQEIASLKAVHALWTPRVQVFQDEESSARPENYCILHCSPKRDTVPPKLTRNQAEEVQHFFFSCNVD